MSSFFALDFPHFSTSFSLLPDSIFLPAASLFLPAASLYASAIFFLLQKYPGFNSLLQRCVVFIWKFAVFGMFRASRLSYELFAHLHPLSVLNAILSVPFFSLYQILVLRNRQIGLNSYFWVDSFLVFFPLFIALLRSLFCHNWHSVLRSLHLFCKSLGFSSVRIYKDVSSQKMNWILKQLAENTRFSSIVSPQMYIAMALYLISECYTKLAATAFFAEIATWHWVSLFFLQAIFVVFWLRKLRKEYSKIKRINKVLSTPLSGKMEVDESQLQENLFRMYYPKLGSTLKEKITALPDAVFRRIERVSWFQLTQILLIGDVCLAFALSFVWL